MRSCPDGATAGTHPTPATCRCFTRSKGSSSTEGITFGDLAGTIEAFTNAFFGPGMHSRLRPSYFPFTEPSAEFEVTCPICAGAGCRTCSGSGWIELGGCGMVDPNVFAAVGIDPEVYTGFAFGFGIDRLAQVRVGLADMRTLLDNDVRFLEPSSRTGRCAHPFPGSATTRRSTPTWPSWPSTLSSLGLVVEGVEDDRRRSRRHRRRPGARRPPPSRRRRIRLVDVDAGDGEATPDRVRRLELRRSATWCPLAPVGHGPARRTSQISPAQDAG